jgi:lipoprotein signal peptidase
MSAQEIENGGNLIDRVVNFFVENEGQWHFAKMGKKSFQIFNLISQIFVQNHGF